MNDLAECLTHALRGAGHEAVIDPDYCGGMDRRWSYRDDAGRLQETYDIVIGAHRESVKLPSYPVVIYQTEVPGSGSFPASFAEKLKGALCVWDSAPGYGTGQAVVEPGWMPTSAAIVEKDIPLLFFGSMSPRREEILTRLHKANLGLECHFNVFGAERNALIDRAQVVVDIKQRGTDPNDKTRTFFLDSRGACVLTENDENAERRLNPDSIVEQCRALLDDADLREARIDQRSNELQRVDVTAGIAALEQALAARQHSWRPGNGHIAHHPV
jgi:hypothetical protein